MRVAAVSKTRKMSQFACHSSPGDAPTLPAPPLAMHSVIPYQTFTSLLLFHSSSTVQYGMHNANSVISAASMRQLLDLNNTPFSEITQKVLDEFQ